MPGFAITLPLVHEQGRWQGTVERGDILVTLASIEQTRTWPAPTRGSVETMLAAMLGCDRALIAGRLRRLRSGAFSNVAPSAAEWHAEYDLRRIWATVLALSINQLQVPQRQANALVADNWPECVRALLAAAAETGLIARPAGMPVDTGPMLVIVPKFALTGSWGIGTHAAASYAVSQRREDRVFTSWSAGLLIDGGPLVDALAETASHHGLQSTPMERAFDNLNHTFGWGTAAAGVPDGRSEATSFLDEGPLVHRVRTLLSLAPAGVVEPASTWAGGKARALMRYVEDPAPIDAWVLDVGTTSDRPRLKHMLNAWALEHGLEPAIRYPETFRAAIGATSHEQIRDLMAQLDGTARDRM